jgi:hypothetical protein
MPCLSDPLMAGNAGIRFDKWVLGAAHMYHGEGVAFDPEGISPAESTRNRFRRATFCK